MAQSATQVLTQPPASQQTQQQTPSASAVTPPAWAAEYKDPNVKSWLASKKYESPEVLATSAYSMEQLFGADKAGRTVMLPKDDTDAEGLKAFHTKIGVPESPDGYKLPRPDDADEAFSKIAATWFHKAGVPAKAAEALTNDWNAFIAAEVQKAEQADAAKAEGELQTLRGEWGPKFEENAEFGRRGLREFGAQAGLDDADLKRLETSLGTAKMLKLFSKIGELTKESSFAGTDGKGGFQGSVASAQEEADRITRERTEGKISDFDWRTRYEKRMLELGEIIAAGTAQQRQVIRGPDGRFLRNGVWVDK